MQAVEWYEQGDGGWTTVNESGIAPSNYTSFQNTGSVTSVLLEDGEAVVGDDGDFVGAFYGDELRGIAGVTPNPIPPSPYFGENAFLVYLYSNASGTEDYTFKFYDASADTVSDIPETITFVSDMTEGTLMSPYSGGKIKKQRFIFTKSILDIFFQMTSLVLKKLLRFLH